MDSEDVVRGNNARRVATELAEECSDQLSLGQRCAATSLSPLRVGMFLALPEEFRASVGSWRRVYCCEANPRYSKLDMEIGGVEARYHNKARKWTS